MEVDAESCNFKKYGSIENHDNKLVEQFQMHFSKEVWIALEKVHGANMSFIVSKVDGNYVVELAKRTSILTEEEETTFFNCKVIKNKYRSHVVDFFRHFKAINNNVHSIHIFGEYFGGRYKDSNGNVVVNNDAKYPQKDIMYCPYNEFIVFDVYVIHEDPSKNYYMNYDDVIMYCKSFDLKFVPIMHQGTIHEMLKLSPEFPTTIPRLLSCEKGNEDPAEGYVIKTLKTMYLPGRPYRAIFKYKSKLFQEKNPVKKTNQPKEIHVSEKTQELLDIATSYVTRARLDCKLASIPNKNPDPANIRKIVGILIGDVIKDFKDDGYEFENKESRHYVTTQLNKQANELVVSVLNAKCA